jgi:hypothetical protein
MTGKLTTQIKFIRRQIWEHAGRNAYKIVIAQSKVGAWEGDFLYWAAVLNEVKRMNDNSVGHTKTNMGSVGAIDGGDNQSIQKR